jgi:transposase
MTRTYNKVTDYQRLNLVEVKAQGHTIKEAAKIVGIPYENAKAIMRVYKQEFRTNKHTVRNRYKTKDKLKNLSVIQIAKNKVPSPKLSAGQPTIA